MLKLNELRRTIKCNWEYWRTCGCVQYSSSFLLYPKSVFLTGWKNTTPPTQPPNYPSPASHLILWGLCVKKKKRASRQSAQAAGLSLVIYFFFFRSSPLWMSSQTKKTAVGCGRFLADRWSALSAAPASLWGGRMSFPSFFFITRKKGSAVREK